MANTYHKLTAGTYSRWVGDAKTGAREEYDAYDPEHNIIPDLSEAELSALGVRVQAVSVGQIAGKKGVTTALPVTAVSAPNVQTDNVVAPIVSIPTTEVPLASSTSTHADLLSKSVPEIEQELKAVTDTATLDSIRDAEIHGKERQGVLKAIKARREELS